MGKSSGKCSGYSLVELMVAVAILMVVAGAAFTFLVGYQDYYQSTALRADMHSSLRGATQLMQQDIGQAGLVSLGSGCSSTIPSTSTTGCPTLTAAVTAGTQTPTVSSTTGMFTDQLLTVDLGAAQETAKPTAVTATTITATFANSHSSGAIISAAGVYPQGILCVGTSCGGGCTASCSSTNPATSSTTDMYLYGDINGDGTLVFVHYHCIPPAAGQPRKTLTRSVTTLLGATAENTPVTLLDNVAANPTGAPPFQYTSATVTVGSNTYTFVTGVSVTLTVQTDQLDPVTKQYTTETKSFLNLKPRSLVAGYNIANNGVSGFFQPGPNDSSSSLSGNCLLTLSCMQVQN